MPNLVINIVGDARSLERALRKSERDTRTFSSRLGRVAKATGIAAGAALGTGIAVGLERSVKAAIEAQKVLGQTRVAVRNAGQSWGAFQGQIEASTKALSNLAAVDDEELLTSFSTLVRVTGDVNRALDLNATVADLARARNMDLQSAALLVAKVAGGNTAILRRYGIQVDKNATSVQALEMLHRRFAGSAAAYGRSAAGAQERFNVALENMQEAIGKGLLPTLTIYLNEASKWLNNTKNQKTASDDLAAALYGVGKAAQFAGEAFGSLNRVGRSLGGAVYDVKRWLGGGDFQDAVRVAQAVKRIQANRAAGAPPTSRFFFTDIGGGAAAGGRRYGIRFPGTHAGPPGRVRGGGQVGMPPQRRAEIRNTIFDSMVARLLGRVEDASSLRVQIGKLRVIAGLIRQQIGVVKDVARQVNLQDQVLDIQAQIRGKQQQITETARQAADAAKQRQQDAIDTQMGWLQLYADQAKTESGRLKWLRQQQKLIQDQIRVQGYTLDLARQLAGVNDQIRDVQKKDLAAAGFRHVNPERLAAMLGLGGNRRAVALLAQVGRGGSLPSGTAQYGGVVITGPVNVHGVQNINQLENEMRKQARGKPAVRRGAR